MKVARKEQRFLLTRQEFNPLNAELNPICHLLALLGSATIVVVSRLRVNQFAELLATKKKKKKKKNKNKKNKKKKKKKNNNNNNNKNNCGRDKSRRSRPVSVVLMTTVGIM